MAQDRPTPFPLHTLRTFTIHKGAPQTISLQLSKGVNYVLHAEQKGIDISLTLHGPAGMQLRYQDAPNGRYGPEELSSRPDSTGVYALTLAALPDSANAETGTCTLIVRRVPDAAHNKALAALLTPAQLQKDLTAFRAIRIGINSGLYRYRTPAQIDSIYRWAAQRIARPMPVTDFYKIILTLTDFEGSCHNSTLLPYRPTDYLPASHGYFPFYLRRAGDRLLVNDSAAGWPAGTELLTIDGRDAHLQAEGLYKYFSTDGYNRTQKESAAVNYGFGWRYPLEYGVRDYYVLTGRLPGTDSIVTLRTRSLSQQEKMVRYQTRHSRPYEALLDPDAGDTYTASLISPSTALLRFRRFDMAANADDPAFATFSHYLDSFFISLRRTGTRNLVIDIRGNPGGNDPTYEKVFTYLTEKPFRENTGAYIISRRLPLPQYYHWQSEDADNQRREQADLEQYLAETFPVADSGRYYQDPTLNPRYLPDSNRFTGRLYLLIDENVASAASHFASLVRGYTDATIIGRETTGGYYGHNGHLPVEYQLPHSKIITRFSIVHVTQDAPYKASQPEGRGIIPDIEVVQSVADFMKNEDTGMKKVMEVVGR